MLTEFERWRREIKGEAEKIVVHAKKEARVVAEQAKSEQRFIWKCQIR